MSIAFTVARLVLLILIDVHIVVTETIRLSIVCRFMAMKRSKLLYPLSVPRLVRNALAFNFAASAHQLLQIKRPPTTHSIRQTADTMADQDYVRLHRLRT